MSQEHGPVGDDADYEDVDFETAVWMGVLSELTAIREEVAGLRADLASVGAGGGVKWRCQDCGDTFADDNDARHHATREHNAPADLWKYHMERVES